VIELVSFDSSQRSSKFVNDELVSFVSVIVVENNRMTKVQGIREEIRDREDVSDLSFGLAINTLTEEDRRLLEVGSLTKQVTEVLQNVANVRSFVHRSSTT
jgi:hypothetical protein